MKRIFKKRPSPALAVSFIALFVALGGVSYGVATGSIDSREIKNNTVRGEDMRSGSVTEREIRRRSLDGTDIKIERVGGNAVKEQVLESEKIGKVPSATNADTANDLAATGAAKYSTRWALVSPGADGIGRIIRQTGGFKEVNCYQDNANCYIDTGEDVTNNGVYAEIATTNGASDAGTPMQTSGDTSVSPCFFDFVLCAPAGTDSNNGGNNGVLVVTPRNSDGTAPADDETKYSFYVYVTGSTSQ